MGITLENKRIKDTYEGLLKTTDNAAASSTSKELTDGAGNDLGIFIDTDGTLGIGGQASVSLDASSNTDAIGVPKGTTSQRPAGAAGYTRYNTSNSKLEYYDTEWENIASESYVTTQINGLIDGAPDALDTLNELAAALNDNANFFNTVVKLTGNQTIAGNKEFTGNTSITSDLAVDTDTLYVDVSTDSVGIGTDTPESHLHVVQEITDDIIYFPLTVSSIDVGNTVNQSTNSGIGIKFELADNTSEGGSFVGGGIAALRGSGTDTESITDLAFYTSNDDETLDERVRIDSSGNLGIGEDSIDAKIHLTSPSSGLVNQKFESAGSAAWRIGVPASQTYFAFDNANDGLTSPKMVIDSDGNVGIGISTINEKLHIHENTSGSSYIQITNSTTGTTGSDGMFVGYNSSEKAHVWSFENTDMLFGTNGTERFRIDNIGNIGIGNGVTPAFTYSGRGIDIEGATGQNAALRLDYGGSGKAFEINSRTGDVLLYDQSGRSLRFGTGGIERFRIDGDSIYINQYLYHNGDTNTYLRYDDDRIYLVAGGVNAIDIQNGVTTLNNNGISQNLRVESNDNVNMFFVNGGSNKVGIGTDVPDTILHIKDANSPQLRLEDTTNSVKAYFYAQNSGTVSAAVGTVSNHGFGIATNGVNRIEIRSYGDVVINDDVLRINEYLQHNDDSDTFIRFLNNEVRHAVGGNQIMKLLSNTAYFNQQITGGIGALTTSGTTDWNDSTNARSGNGYTLLQGAHTNGPNSSASYYHPFSFEYAGYDGDGNMTQFAIPYNSAAMYHRYRYSDTWSGWYEHMVSDTSGSFYMDEYLYHRGDTDTFIQFASAGNEIYLQAGTSSNYLKLHNNGYNYLGGTGQVLYGDVFIEGYIKHNNDSNTYFGFNDNDQYRVVANGLSMLQTTATEIVINEDSADYNFRVESDGNANMLFVDGGLDRVGIGTNSPDKILHIEGNNDTNSQIKIVRTDQSKNTHYASGYAGTFSAHGFDIYTNSTSRISVSSSGGIELKSSSIYIDEHLYHRGDTDTFLRFTNNQIDFDAGGYTFFRINTSEVVVNEDTRDVDFRVEGDTNTHALFVEGSSNNVMLGSSTSSKTSEGARFLPAGAGSSSLFQINNTGSSHCLELWTNASTSDVAQFYRQTTKVGSISVSLGATAYNTSSDYRLKTDLKDFDGLGMINKIKMYDFEWKESKTRAFGVMAHELGEVIPQAVTGEKDGEEMQSVDYSKIVPALVKAIQQQQEEIENLKSKIQ